jgi:hypothetical protein
MSQCPFSNIKKHSEETRETIQKDIELYLMQPFDKNFLPKKPDTYKGWWEEDSKTTNHAKFCLPLLMANGLGHDILSPATFEVSWSGNNKEDARINILEHSSHSIVDNHSAGGAFTVQANFIPKTEKGCFTFIKGIPNVRRSFSVMEGLIETWWNPAHFGIVCLCNYPGSFIVKKGEPIARMLFISDEYIKTNLIIKDNDMEIPFRQDFLEKRANQNGHVLDYFKGKYPNGEKTEYHIKPSDLK